MNIDSNFEQILKNRYSEDSRNKREEKIKPSFPVQRVDVFKDLNYMGKSLFLAYREAQLTNIDKKELDKIDKSLIYDMVKQIDDMAVNFLNHLPEEILYMTDLMQYLLDKTRELEQKINSK